MLASLVVKQALGQGSYNLYVPESPHTLMYDQLHQESQEYQMRSCCEKTSAEAAHLCEKNKNLSVQINTFELPSHVKNHFHFHQQVLSLYCLLHEDIYPANKIILFSNIAIKSILNCITLK